MPPCHCMWWEWLGKHTQAGEEMAFESLLSSCAVNY